MAWCSHTLKTKQELPVVVMVGPSSSSRHLCSCRAVPNRVAATALIGPLTTSHDGGDPPYLDRLERNCAHHAHPS